ncbi:MAG: signal peptidase II [Beijerinckiaceae bacterium]|nr:signal peptidase II [Beijerinckiaceae bacterium]
MEGEARPSVDPAALRIGLAIALVCLLADQASKLWLIYGTTLRLTYPWPVLPFIDFTVVWNRGISYGLFQQDSEAGRWFLAAFKIAAAIVLTLWLRKSANRLETTGIGLIIGGAIGNAIDRILHGAVFDFVHFHVGEFSWYVFNIADAAIVFGVIFMVLGQILPSRAPESP